MCCVCFGIFIILYIEFMWVLIIMSLFVLRFIYVCWWDRGCIFERFEKIFYCEDGVFLRFGFGLLFFSILKLYWKM